MDEKRSQDVSDFPFFNRIKFYYKCVIICDRNGILYVFLRTEPSATAYLILIPSSSYYYVIFELDGFEYGLLDLDGCSMEGMNYCKRIG